MALTDIITEFRKERQEEKQPLKAVLFDMDGVLFDSMKNHTLAWYRAISALGIPCEREEFYQYEGATGTWTVNLIFNRVYGRNATESEVEEIYAEKSRYFNGLPEAEPMPGAGELLRKVKEAGIIPVLVTGSGQKSLLSRLEKVYPNVFRPENMVTAFDVRRGKPDPEPYLKGLEKAGVRSGEAWVVENAALGVQAGVAAGIFTIAVNTGPIPDQQLRDAGAGLLFHSMNALAEQFEELVSNWDKV